MTLSTSTDGRRPGDSGRRLKLLIVDDSIPVLEWTSKWLQDQGFVESITVAHNGLDGVVQAEARRPDLVIMDLNMPVMNGWEATRRIKQAAHPPRVILFSFDVPENGAARAREAGADGICSKEHLHAQLVPLILSLFPDEA